MLKTMKNGLLLTTVWALTGCGPADDDLVEVPVEIGEAEQAVIILPNDFGKVRGRESTDDSRCRHSPKNYTNSFCLIPKFGGPGPCLKIRINHPAGVATAAERDAIDFGIQMSTNQ